MVRQLIPWILTAACIGAALWLRLHWIENPAVARQCLAGGDGIGCAMRALAIDAFHGPWLTATAAASALLALLWRHPWSAALAAAAGGVALVLYTAEIGAFTLLLGLLWLQYRQRHAPAGRRSSPATH